MTMLMLTRRRLLACGCHGAGALALGGLGLLADGADHRAHAQGRSIPVLRDEEIERALAHLSGPLADAAGLSRKDIGFTLVADDRINAFVAGGQTVFLNTGLITAVDHVDEVLGVVAHEMGHITGGHVPRMTVRAGQIARETMITALLLAGLAGGASGDGRALQAGLGGYAEMFRSRTASAMRALEGSADEAALTYLHAARWPADGMIRFMERLAAEFGGLTPSEQAFSYRATHPFPGDRVQAVRARAERLGMAMFTLPDGMQPAFRRLQAKVFGYTQPDAALRRHGPQETDPDGLYARLFALYRRNDHQAGLDLARRLRALEPRNPWLMEVEGQILLDSGRVAEALGPLRAAVEAVPDSALVTGELGRALVQSDDPALLQEAVLVLTRSVTLEPGISRTLYQLATAHGRLGDRLRADRYLAEMFLVQLQLKDAIAKASLVEQNAPFGSPVRLQAEAIIAEAKALRAALGDR